MQSVNKDMFTWNGVTKIRITSNIKSNPTQKNAMTFLKYWRKKKKKKLKQKIKKKKQNLKKKRKKKKKYNNK